jgi:hypothetical protein
MNTKIPNPNYKALQEKAALVALQTESLLNDLKSLKSELPEIERYSDGLTALNIIDYLNNVESTLYSRTDGRPNPFFAGEELWGMCYEAGYDEKAMLKD